MNSRKLLSRNTQALHLRKGMAPPYLPRHDHVTAREIPVPPAKGLKKRPSGKTPLEEYKPTLADM